MKVQQTDDIIKMNNEFLEQKEQQNVLTLSTSYLTNASFLICGLVNNSGYVMVLTAAQDIANQFDKGSFMGSFNLSLIFFSIFMVGLNANTLITIPHQKRMNFILVLSAISFFILGFCVSIQQPWAFYVALIGSTLQGMAQCLGEATMLGYSKNFPSYMVGFWSSGTGLAGPFGSGVYLGLVALKVSKIYIFLILIPCLIIYKFCLMWLNKYRMNSDETTAMVQNQSSAQSEELQDESTNNQNLTFKTAKETLKNYTGFYSLNLGLVYFFEYTCIVCWADRANPKPSDKTGFINENAFAILNFCYQIGVFISRSSLQCIKIEKIHILTIIQFINTGVWIYIAISKSVSIVFQILLMLFVGLMGGSSYVNVAYIIVSSNKIPKQFKELALNINSITNSFGILCATLVTFPVDNLWLKS